MNPRSLAALVLLAPALALAQAPPEAEILSGKALNALVDWIAARKAALSTDPDKLLDQKALAALNVATPSGLEVRLVTRAHRLTWPSALHDLRADREAVCQLLPEAVKLARKGKVPAKVMKPLAAAVKSLDARLVANVADLTPLEYILAKRFANRLKDAVERLGKPDVKAQLALADGLLTRGRTAPELARFLAARKLRVAPVLPGDEVAYRGLHQALAEHEKRAGGAKKAP